MRAKIADADVAGAEGETSSTGRDYFDALYDKTDDPWRIAGNWYEQRKRNLVTAILPRRRFRHAFEPGCGSGELTQALGSRCDRILAGDLAPAAVEIARERWERAAMARRIDCAARFACMAVPRDWPVRLGNCFDLIVFSEFAYYLDQAGLDALPQLADASLAPDGVLLACHWKRPFDRRLHATAAVHACLARLPGLQHLGRYEDADFLLDVWGRETRSLAQQEDLA